MYTITTHLARESFVFISRTVTNNRSDAVVLQRSCLDS